MYLKKTSRAISEGGKNDGIGVFKARGDNVVGGVSGSVIQFFEF